MGNKYNIPKYHGRIFKLSPNNLSINDPYDEPCENALLKPHKISALELIGRSISTRIFSKSGPTPKDMQLPLANDASVTALYLSCDGKTRAKDQGAVANKDLSDAVWFINLDNDKLAVSWHEETILVLNRLAKNTKPVASFDCSKAGTRVERTICNSVGLAAYDRSLGQTYKQARDYYHSQNDQAAVKELSVTQKAWLEQRNKCVDDVKCLEKAMSDRIVDIIYDLADYTYQHR